MKIIIDLTDDQALALIGFSDRLAATPTRTPCNFLEENNGLVPLQEAMALISQDLILLRAEAEMQGLYEVPPAGQS